MISNLNTTSCLKWALKEFLLGGHLQSLGAVSLMYGTNLLLHGDSPPLIYGAIIYLLVHAVYLFNRNCEFELDRPTNIERCSHISSYRRFHFFMIVSELLAVGVLSWFAGGARALFVSLALIALGFFYTIKGKALTAIIPCCKGVMVAACFTCASQLPAINGFYSLLFWTRFDTVWSLAVFASILLMQAYLDIKDEPTDRRLGLKTLPVLFGTKNTINIYALGVFFLHFAGPAFLLVLAQASVIACQMAYVLIGLGIYRCVVLFMHRRSLLAAAIMEGAGMLLVWPLAKAVSFCGLCGL